MLKTITRDGFTYAQMKDLSQWEKNPKTVTTEAFQKLLNDIEHLGDYKPLIVNSGKLWGTAGTVLGGNTRFMAYIDLKKTEAWVSVVSPKDEEEAIAFALSDNEAVGQYDPERLAELVLPYRGGLLDTFKAQLNTPIAIASLLNSFAPPTTQDATTPSDNPVERDQRPTRDIDSYMNAAVKQITMHFPAAEYNEVIEQVQSIMELEELENVTEVFKHLLKCYDEGHYVEND